MPDSAGRPSPLSEGEVFDEGGRLDELETDEDEEGVLLPALMDAIEDEEGTASLLILLVPEAEVGSAEPALFLIKPFAGKMGLLGLASSSSSSSTSFLDGGSGSQLSFLPFATPLEREVASGLRSISCSSAVSLIWTVVFATRSLRPGDSSRSARLEVCAVEGMGVFWVSEREEATSWRDRYEVA